MSVKYGFIRERKLLAQEIDYLRRSSKVSRLEKNPNTFIGNKKNNQFYVDRIQRSQLKWPGRLLRMEDSRWPKKNYQWTPHGRRRKPTAIIMEEPGDGLHEEQRHGRGYGGE